MSFSDVWRPIALQNRAIAEERQRYADLQRQHEQEQHLRDMWNIR